MLIRFATSTQNGASAYMHTTMNTATLPWFAPKSGIDEPVIIAANRRPSVTNIRLTRGV